MAEIREIVNGNFIEGEYVTVNINGNIVKRKVYYSKDAGDLYVWCKNRKYFYYEFWR